MDFDDCIALAEARGFKGAQIGLEAFWIWLKSTDKETDNETDKEVSDENK